MKNRIPRFMNTPDIKYNTVKSLEPVLTKLNEVGYNIDIKENECTIYDRELDGEIHDCGYHETTSGINEFDNIFKALNTFLEWYI